MQVVRIGSPHSLDVAASATTVGNFDGVHRGHRQMIEIVRDVARSFDGEAAVLTFDPHPTAVIEGAQPVGALMTLDQKLEALEAAGVGRVVLLEFDPALARLSPARFVDDFLVETLHSRVVVVGSTFRFGHRRSAGVDDLRRLGSARGFAVREVEPVLAEGLPISSTRIREAVSAGQVRQAATLLGRLFELEGEVVRGDGRGRTLGVPTANVVPRNGIQPAPAVYAGELVAGGAVASAVINIGRRPTFGGGTIAVEAHALDFDADLYGRVVRLRFAERLRDERRFASKDDLLAQIAKDVAEAREILGRARGQAI